MSDVNARVNKHRAALRASGLRPVQIWVPDSRAQAFAEQAQQQARRVARADRKDPALLDALDAWAADVPGWAE